MTEYVVLTAIQQFRTRYVVPIEEIKDCDPEIFIKDSVIFGEVKEFSQLNLKENIIDVQLYNEDNLLGWDKEQKINWIKNWEEGL